MRLFALAVLGRNYESSKDYLHWAKTWRTQLDINKFYFCLPWQQHVSPCLSVPLPSWFFLLPLTVQLLVVQILFFCFWWFIKEAGLIPACTSLTWNTQLALRWIYVFPPPAWLTILFPWQCLLCHDFISKLWIDAVALRICKSCPFACSLFHWAHYSHWGEKNFNQIFSILFFWLVFGQKKKCISLKIHDIFITQ